MKNQGATDPNAAQVSATAGSQEVKPAETQKVETTPAQEAAMQRVSDQVFKRLTGSQAPEGDGKGGQAAGGAKSGGDGKAGDDKEGKEEKRKEAPKAGDEPKGDKGDNGEGGKPASETTPKERRRSRQRDQPAPSAEDITAAATAAATKAVAEVVRPKESAKPAAADPNEVNPMFKASADEIKYLAAQPKYTGLIQKYNEFAVQVEQYVANWRKENPGRKFDDQDEEHAEFFATAPQVDERDWARASGAVEARRAVHDEIKPLLKDKEDQKEREQIEQAAAAIAPAIQTGTGRVTRDIIATLAGERWKDTMTPDERTALLKEITEDPIDGPVLERHLSALQPVVELATLEVSANGAMFINERDPAVAKTLEAVRRDIALLEDTMDGVEDGEGRVFAPRAEFSKMNAAQKKLHYTVDPGLMAEFYSRHAKRMVTEAVAAERKKLEAGAKKLGWAPKSGEQSVPKSGQDGQSAKGGQGEGEAKSGAARTGSVSLSGGGPAVSVSGSGERAPESTYDKAFRKMTGT